MILWKSLRLHVCVCGICKGWVLISWVQQGGTSPHWALFQPADKNHCDNIVSFCISLPLSIQTTKIICLSLSKHNWRLWWAVMQPIHTRKSTVWQPDSFRHCMYYTEIKCFYCMLTYMRVMEEFPLIAHFNGEILFLCFSSSNRSQRTSGGNNRLKIYMFVWFWLNSIKYSIRCSCCFSSPLSKSCIVRIMLI